MADITQYTFDLRDVAIALIKAQGLHEGKWVIALELGLAAGLFGSDPKDPTAVNPGAIIAVQSIQLTKHPENAPVHRLVVDAAEVNPATTPARRSQPDAERQRRKPDAPN
jgi:hypothetical protein